MSASTLGEHAPDDVALALETFGPHDRSGLGRHLDGAVFRVVVEDVDGRVRQRGLETGDGVADSHLLIVTRDEDGDAEGGVAHDRLPGGGEGQCGGEDNLVARGPQ